MLETEHDNLFLINLGHLDAIIWKILLKLFCMGENIFPLSSAIDLNSASI